MNATTCILAASGLLLTAVSARAEMLITVAPGFTILWDGNDGDHFDPDEPAPVPPNLATGDGAVAFASSELGPEIGIDFHVALNLSDGLYGNANSWISASSDPTPAFAGIRLGGVAAISSFAFGRDNGNDITDVNGGQLKDRTLGLYTVQITRVSFPDETTEETGDATTGWVTVGTIEYLGDDDEDLGEGFTSWLRHEFEIAEDGAPVQATGFRLIVPLHGMGGGTAIDEIELYGPGVVNPDSDGDGFDDEVETALGFNPNDPASTPESRSGIRTAVEFSFYAAKHRKYRIEASTNLREWTTVEEGIIGRGAEVTRLFSTSGGAARHYRAVRIP